MQSPGTAAWQAFVPVLYHPFNHSTKKDNTQLGRLPFSLTQLTPFPLLSVYRSQREGSNSIEVKPSSSSCVTSKDLAGAVKLARRDASPGRLAIALYNNATFLAERQSPRLAARGFRDAAQAAYEARQMHAQACLLALAGTMHLVSDLPAEALIDFQKEHEIVSVVPGMRRAASIYNMGLARFYLGVSLIRSRDIEAAANANARESLTYSCADVFTAVTELEDLHRVEAPVRFQGLMEDVSDSSSFLEDDGPPMTLMVARQEHGAYNAVIPESESPTSDLESTSVLSEGDNALHPQEYINLREEDSIRRVLDGLGQMNGVNPDSDIRPPAPSGGQPARPYILRTNAPVAACHAVLSQALETLDLPGPAQSVAKMRTQLLQTDMRLDQVHNVHAEEFTLSSEMPVPPIAAQGLDALEAPVQRSKPRTLTTNQLSEMSHALLALGSTQMGTGDSPQARLILSNARSIAVAGGKSDTELAAQAQIAILGMRDHLHYCIGRVAANLVSPV